jgi:hypothetical protein
MATSPLYTDPAQRPGPVLAATTTDTIPERLDRIEDEVAELRDTVARFADLMIGEVKDLRKSQADLPPMPPAIVGELPANSQTSPHAESSAANPNESNGVRASWMLTGMLHDFGTAFRMYFDPRYRMRRGTQIFVPIILLIFAANCAFFNLVFTVPFLSSALEKIVDVLLAILLYKVVSKEVQRYRHVLAQLMAWQDYRAQRSVVIVGGEAPTTRQEMD